ncbi:hypothetical protein, partial [Microcoleus sp. Z1_C3]|uniref:hypothetical protein n=1 Tax=unclassified Microcoleus TaxID=2642155 RepID=UPI002FD36BCF
FHRIQVFYFWTDESRGGYPGCGNCQKPGFCVKAYTAYSVVHEVQEQLYYVVLVRRVRRSLIFDKDCRLMGGDAPYSRLSSCVYHIYMEYAVTSDLLSKPGFC